MSKDNDTEAVKDETEAAPQNALSGVEREAVLRGDNLASLSSRVSADDVAAVHAAAEAGAED
jgi:hypothetical protein